MVNNIIKSKYIFVEKYKIDILFFNELFIYLLSIY